MVFSLAAVAALNEKIRLCMHCQERLLESVSLLSSCGARDLSAEQSSIKTIFTSLFYK